MALPSRTTKILLIAGASILAMSWGVAPSQAKQTQKKSNAAAKNQPRRELQQLGAKIAKAVLDKDIPTLLSYDRGDLRAQDEIALKNPKSDLYCYIFDSECITWGNEDWRSVYDKISQAHPLEILVSLARSPADHQLYGTLLFYDGDALSEKDLQSQDFLCQKAPAEIASWKFRHEGGKWKAVTPLFDSETEGLCPH